MFVTKKVYFTVPQKELSICLPFLGKQSLELKSKLTRFSSKYFPTCRIKVVFKCKNRLKNFLVFKDRIPLSVRSHLLYRYTCSGCNAIYIGKTKRHYLVRVFEHLGISMRTHKKFTYNANYKNNSAILNHVNCQKCVGKEENFKIIGSATNDFHLLLKESLLINKQKPSLNTSDNSLPLSLFWFIFIRYFSFFCNIFMFSYFYPFILSFSYLFKYSTFERKLSNILLCTFLTCF